MTELKSFRNELNAKSIKQQTTAWAEWRLHRNKRECCRSAGTTAQITSLYIKRRAAKHAEQSRSYCCLHAETGGWKGSALWEQSKEKNQQIRCTHRLLREKNYADKDNCQNLLKRHIFHYLQREIFGELSDAKHISALDASAASWQVPLEKQSACLWAFNALFERHFPQPVTWAEFSTREVFHWKIQHIFVSVSGRVPKSTKRMLTSGENVQKKHERSSSSLWKELELLGWSWIASTGNKEKIGGRAGWLEAPGCHSRQGGESRISWNYWVQTKLPYFSCSK